MSKVYKGYELMKLVSQGKLSLKQRVNSLSIDYKNCTIDFILKDSAFNIMDLDFKLIEDEIDIDSIEELDSNNKTIWSIKPNDEWTRCGTVNVDIFSQMKENQNSIIRAVKQLNKEIKSIKEK